MSPPCFLVLLIAFVGSATRDEVEVGADALQLDFTATGKQHIWNKGFAAAGVIDSVGEVDTTPASQSSLMDSSGEKGSRPASGSSGASLTLVSQPSSDPYDSNGEDDSRPSAGKEIKGSGSNVYKYIQELGAGAFGLVWMARQTRGDSGDTVAIKTSTDKAKAETEYFALKQCEGSRFVVRMFDHFKDNGGRYYIVMEFAEAGDLAKALHDNTPIDKLSIAKDIVSALVFLKQRKVAHMDLKPGNVLLWNSGDQWTAKLTDFGLAVLNIDQEKTKSVGTGAYASPEVFRPPFWGPEVDVWTFGVLLYEMVTGEQPYTYYERQPDRNRQERQNFPREKHTAALESVPLEIQEIIIRTQTFDSGARITIEQIRSSSLFQQASLSLQSRQSLPPSSSVVTSSLTPVLDIGFFERGKDAKSELATDPASTTSLNKIGYIGSPGNLVDLKIKGTICTVLSGLASRGFQVYVGTPNEALRSDAPVQVQDMHTAGIAMFDAVIVLPGGPAARDEAQRFSGKTKLFIFINSASERGRPEWFNALITEGTFDLNDMQTDVVVETIFKALERPSATFGNSTQVPVDLVDLDKVPVDLVGFFEEKNFRDLCAYFQGLVKKHGLVDGKQEVLKTYFKRAIPEMLQVSPEKSEAYYTIFDKSIGGKPQRGKVNLIEFLKGFQALENGEFERQEAEKARNAEMFEQSPFALLLQQKKHPIQQSMDNAKGVDWKKASADRKARATKATNQKIAGRDDLSETSRSSSRSPETRRMVSRAGHSTREVPQGLENLQLLLGSS